GKNLSTIDSAPFLILVIGHNQFTILIGQFAQTLIQTIQMSLSIRCVVVSDLRGCPKIFGIQRGALYVAALKRFQTDQARNLVAVAADVFYLSALIQFARHSVEGVVGLFFGEGGAAPFEEPGKNAPQVFI